MTNKGNRPPPDLTDSSLVHYQDQIFVDSATGMILSRIGWIGSGGYERIDIDGRTLAAHRVVVEALHGPIPPGHVINHLNSATADNHPSNLEVTTPGGNVRHSWNEGNRERRAAGAYTHGRTPTPSRLSPQDIERIKSAPKGTITVLAAELGISRAWAYTIRGGKKRVTGRYPSVANLAAPSPRNIPRL